MIIFTVAKAGEGRGNEAVETDFELCNNEVTGFKVIAGDKGGSEGIARSRNFVAGMELTGKVLATFGDEAADDSINLVDWAACPAESAAAYRNVMVTLKSAGQVERSYALQQAYVESYQEFHDRNNGTTFKLVLSQRRTGNEIDDMVEIKGGY